MQQRLTGRAGGAGAALSPALDAEAHALAGHYVALEEAYLRGCVAKARAGNAINEVSAGLGPHGMLRHSAVSLSPLP